MNTHVNLEYTWYKYNACNINIWHQRGGRINWRCKHWLNSSQVCLSCYIKTANLNVHVYLQWAILIYCLFWICFFFLLITYQIKLHLLFLGCTRKTSAIFVYKFRTRFNTLELKFSILIYSKVVPNNSLSFKNSNIQQNIDRHGLYPW